MLARAAVSDRDKEIVAKTNSHCHICGRGIDTSRRGTFAFDHVVPRELGGSDDPSNLLLACTKCNGLRWDHHPETIQRILFLGVIANYDGYKNATPSSQSGAIRRMRALRLLQNLAKGARLSKAEKTKLLRRFTKFEDEIARRVEQGKKAKRQARKEGVTEAKGIKVRWTELVDAALSETDGAIPPRYKAAYRRLVQYEKPGPEELKTTQEAESARGR